MAQNKILIRRRAAGLWACTRPPYGFGYCDTRLFRSWRMAMDWATEPAVGSVASADLQLSSQTHDAVGSVPMWTPITY